MTPKMTHVGVESAATQRRHNTRHNTHTDNIDRTHEENAPTKNKEKPKNKYDLLLPKQDAHVAPSHTRVRAFLAASAFNQMCPCLTPQLYILRYIYLYIGACV